jgi:putative ABC transport system permease protein
MMLWESFGIALTSLRANKMRSFLTMLGIIIGVASLITTIAVGAGAQTKVAEQIRSFGANVLLVTPGAAQVGGVRTASGSGHTLTESDASAISKQLPQVQAAAPSIQGPSQIIRGNKNWNTVVNGTTADYFITRDWELSRGRYFSEYEEERGGKVAVIGATVAKQLFGKDDPIGQHIRISSTERSSGVPDVAILSRNPGGEQVRISSPKKPTKKNKVGLPIAPQLSVPFSIIGVLAEKGSTPTGGNQDDSVFVPLSTAKVRLLGSGSQIERESVTYILVKVGSDEGMAAATAAIEALLKQRHRLDVDRKNDFEVINPAAVMAAQRASATTIAWLFAAIASVSLVVGGISIMNIMLVSVTERTREIGLRLAIGARRRDIRNQFLTEAVSLCLLGGAIGVGFGALAAWAVAALAGWPIFLGPEGVLLAVGFAAVVGIFFGYYPARKAAKLEPVVALRSA